VNPATGSR